MKFPFVRFDFYVNAALHRFGNNPGQQMPSSKFLSTRMNIFCLFAVNDPQGGPGQTIPPFRKLYSKQIVGMPTPGKQVLSSSF